jgi:hypothetical protein
VAGLDKKRPYFQNTQSKRSWRHGSSGREHLPHKHEALHSNPSTEKERKERREGREGEREEGRKVGRKEGKREKKKSLAPKHKPISSWIDC